MKILGVRNENWCFNVCHNMKSWDLRSTLSENEILRTNKLLNCGIFFKLLFKWIYFWYRKHGMIFQKINHIFSFHASISIKLSCFKNFYIPLLCSTKIFILAELGLNYRWNYIVYESILKIYIFNRYMVDLY